MAVDFVIVFDQKGMTRQGTYGGAAAAKRVQLAPPAAAGNILLGIPPFVDARSCCLLKPVNQMNE